MVVYCSLHMRALFYASIEEEQRVMVTSYYYDPCVRFKHMA